ncbi:unnamed protein product [Dracunculus medinensis]|uniref:Vacuolar protein sorting-associated protein 45 n=1 Tax=Dracunculus medinensis TaxID=318479 RepID=A0A0N4UKJ7_DRAME|nr:unnamed protein product [Dracunculus medinensis]
MDLVTATRQYISEMIRLAGPGMKIMMMDKETTSTISCVYAQSDVMQKEVYLFERIDSGIQREPIKYLKCISYLRPTPENINLLCQELRSPKYGQYYIYFCNIISKTDVKTLAESDEQEMVREMHEFYMDGVALCPHLFTLNIPQNYGLSYSFSLPVFRRSILSIISVLLAMKKKPLIRYQFSYPDAKRLAEEVARAMIREENLFETCKSDTVMLIINRSEDPVTPLLNQWTYEAMVHELLGITNHRVTTDSASDLGTVLLSPFSDSFYSNNMYADFGEIGQNIKNLMTEFQRKSQTTQKLESISDMKNFVEQYPQFKRISGTLSKHVSVVGELSRLVSARNLLEISEVEQQIVCNGEHSQCLDAVRRLLQNNQTTEIDLTRLVMLYALRFESHANNDTQGLMQLLKRRNVSNKNFKAVKAVLDFTGSSARRNDLFGRSAIAITKKLIKGIKGVENIYTQYEPYINQLIDSLAKGKLSETVYPFITSGQNSKADNIILFVIGGTTYAESRIVHLYNERRYNGANLPAVLLLSTTVLNTQRFHCHSF